MMKFKSPKESDKKPKDLSEDTQEARHKAYTVFISLCKQHTHHILVYT